MGDDIDDTSLDLNNPTQEGIALGEQLARLCDGEFARNPTLRERCADCAFRLGTPPNQSAGTLMNALKAAAERSPFYCHIERGVSSDALCAGWEAMIFDEGVTVPWDYLK